MWPIWLINNELEPNIRFKKEYIQLVGLWFGKKKPHMNTFLTPLVQMFNDAFNEGNLKYNQNNNTGIQVMTPNQVSIKSTALLLAGNYCHFVDCIQLFWI